MSDTSAREEIRAAVKRNADGLSPEDLRNLASWLEQLAEKWEMLE